MVLVSDRCYVVGNILLVETICACVTLISRTTEACKLSHIGILQHVVVGVVNIESPLSLDCQTLNRSNGCIPVGAEDVHDILALVILQLTGRVRDRHE